MKSGYDQFFKKAKNSNPESSRPLPIAKKKIKYSLQKPKNHFPIKSMMMFFVLIVGVIVFYDRPV